MEAQKPKAQTSAKKNAPGIKNASWVIVICAIICVCFFIFFLGNEMHFEDGHPINIWGTIYKGGFIVPVLQTLFLTVIVLAVERGIALSAAKGKGNITKFVAGVKASLAKGDIEGARKLCAAQKGSVAAVVDAALVRYEEMDKNTVLTKEQKIANLQKQVEEATALEMPTLQQNLPIIATMTTLGTLVGLLGTVMGMIKGSYQHRLRYRNRCIRCNLLQLLHQQNRQPHLRNRRNRFLNRADICSYSLIPIFQVKTITN